MKYSAIVPRTRWSAGILIFLLTTAFSLFDAAGADRQYFNHLKSTNSGLSYNCVHSIIQDSRGFIWLGTSDGLNRYDGVNFKTFYKDELGLNSCFIISLCEDNNGNIWVGTDSGITVYDFAMDCFRPLKEVSDQLTMITNKVTVIKKDRNGLMWMAVNNQGLFCYDHNSGKLKNYFVEDGKSTLSANISSFCFDNNDRCWLALYFTNLYLADDNLQDITAVNFSDKRDSFDKDNIVEIIESPYNTLYVASVNRGICEIDAKRGTSKRLISNDDNLSICESMFFDKNRVLWVPTTNGVYSYNTGNGKTEHLRANSNDIFSLSDNHALSIFIDNFEGVWIGTNAAGVSYSGVFQKNFEKHYLVNNELLNGSLVRGVADDGKGTYWIATERAGLLYYSANSAELKRFKSKYLPESLFGICYDDGKLWLGTFQGVCRLDINSGEVKTYNRIDKASSLRDNKIYIICRTQQGELLVGTTLGMLKYDKLNDNFNPIPGLEGVFVTDIIENSRGELWIATYANGLIRYSLEELCIADNYTNDPKDANSLPCNKVLSVFVDHIGRTWVTTFGGGFCLYNERENNFHIYNQSTLGKGVPSDINYMIEEDDEGNLWISSNKGLIYFTPENADTRVYTTTDGLLNNEFNYNSSYKLQDGRLFFGSTDGFILFNPKKLHTDTTIPEIIITDFYIGDDIIKPSGKESSLECNIDLTEQIFLKAKQNSFGFGFSLLGSASPASNTILCKLEGYHNKWQKVTDNNTIFFSNIPAGRYKLYVKSINSNGTSNDEHGTIDIVVAQRLYKSTAVIVLYILLSIVLISLYLQYLYRKIARREKKRKEEYEKQKEIELFKEKINFFTSIVHEVKTPLTLIRTPLQNILSTNRCDEETREDLMLIDSNTEYLMQLVKEMLDFVRIESHGYILEFSEIELIEKIGFLCLNFSETAKNNNINLKFVHQQEQIYVNADAPGLNKILNNLLHNAVKYAESYIEVEVKFLDEDRVEISFTNDGPTIAQEYRDEIFKPFVQYNDRAQSNGVGIGLSLAKTLTEMHSGSLVIADDVDRCRFVLSLSAKLHPEESLAESEIEEEMPLEKESSSLPTLLIVEDNSNLLIYLKRKLQDRYKILTCDYAEKALEIVKSKQVDIVITDIALQAMSGLDLCKEIGLDFETSHIPVIILSAHSSTESKIEAMRYGAKLYIEKPFSMEYLQQSIESILEKRGDLKRASRDKVIPQLKNIYDLVESDEKFLYQLDSVILENISNPLFSNEQLAEALYLSKSTLLRKIKGLLDTTPNDYIRTKRLVVAAKMLTEKNCRINEICYSVGFNTPSYFAKCFKKAYGILPAEYAKKNRENK